MLNPWMLLGLLGLSVPVIIHLIQRQKLQPRLLATLKFLDQTDVANAFAWVPRDLLQLILRLALLSLFVLLMARCVMQADRPGARALAVVLDQSMGMQRKLASGKTLFEAAKEDIGRLFAELGPHDQVAFTLVGDDVTVQTGFLRDPARLQRVLAGAEVTEGGARALPAAVTAAVRRMKSLKQPNTCVIVFSPGTRAAWAAMPAPSPVPPLLRRGRVKLFVVGPALEAAPNVSVEEASFSPSSVYLGAGSKMTALVRNGSEEPRDLQVAISESKRQGESRPLHLAPGETAAIDLVQFFDAPADVPCSVQAGDDVLPADNVFHVPMRVRDRRQVLLVTPPAREETAEGVRASSAGVDLLAYAVNPGESLGLGGGTQIALKRVTPNLLERVSLPIYSCVVLYGLSEIPDKSVRDLAGYVRDGGALYIVPDRRTNPVQFNDVFGPLLSGFRLGALKEPRDPVFMDRDESALTSPLLRPLVREEWGDVDDISFSAWFAVEEPGGALCALRAAGREWLAAEAPLGRGGVFLQLFSCDVADTTLPRSPAFVPFVQVVLASLGRRARPPEPDVMRVGEVAFMDVPELLGLKADAELAGPERRSVPLDAGDPARLRVAGLKRAGPYLLTHPEKKGMRPRWLAVNPATGSSDLTPLDAADIGRLFGTRNVAGVSFDHLASLYDRRSEVFPVVFVLVFLAFAAEAVAGAWRSMRRRDEHE